MRNNTSFKLFVVTLSASFIFYSCQKSIDKQADFNEISSVANSSNSNQGVTPYKFERINENNFSSQGWKEQQVNNIGSIRIFSGSSDHMEIVCGPDNDTDPRLIQGSITMNLPTSADPTLRRIRLRKEGYSGTRLTDLTELKYSTFVVQNAATIIVLSVDINNDDLRDFTMFFDPRSQSVNNGPVILNTWQQWDALNGTWRVEVVPLPEFPGSAFTMEELLSLPQYANARIIDTSTLPEEHDGEGIRFTIGGDPRANYANTIGYFDALIIGTKDKHVSTLYDFTCSQGND